MHTGLQVASSIPLQDWQILRVFGWLGPTRRVLRWADVVTREDLTFTRLVDDIGLSVAQLHMLQPDGSAWARSERLGLLDTVRMAGVWDGVHPLRDLRYRCDSVPLYCVSKTYVPV